MQFLLVLFILLSGVFTAGLSKGFEIAWDQSYGDTGKDAGGKRINEALYDAVQLPDGGYFAVGWRYHNKSEFYYDGLFVHTDAAGNEIKRGMVGTKDLINIPGVVVDTTGALYSDEYLYAIAAGPDGDFICGGYRGKRQVSQDSTVNNGSWLLRIDKDANIKWEVIVDYDKNYGDCHVNDIVATSDGGYIAIAGELYPGKKYTSFYDDRPNDYGRVIKFTADGVIQWVKEIDPILNAGFAGFRIEELQGSTKGRYLVSGGGHGLILDETGAVTKKINDMTQVTGHGGVWDQFWSMRQMSDGRILGVGGGTWPGSWEKYGFLVEEMNFTYYTADGDHTDKELVLSAEGGGWNGFGLDCMQLLGGDILLYSYLQDNFFALCDTALTVQWTDRSLTLNNTEPSAYAHRLYRIVPTADSGFTVVGMKTKRQADGKAFEDNQGVLVHFKPTITAVVNAKKMEKSNAVFTQQADKLVVHASTGESVTVSIYSLLGKKITGMSGKQLVSVNTTSFAPGLYLAKIESTFGVESRSFIIH